MRGYSVEASVHTTGILLLLLNIYGVIITLTTMHLVLMCLIPL